MLDLAGLRLTEAMPLLESYAEGRRILVVETSGYRSETDSADATDIRVIRVTESEGSLTVLTARF